MRNDAARNSVACRPTATGERYPIGTADLVGSCDGACGSKSTRSHEARPGTGGVPSHTLRRSITDDGVGG